MKKKLLLTLLLPIISLASCGGNNAGDSSKLVTFKSNVPKTYQYHMDYQYPDLSVTMDLVRTYVTANEKQLYVEYSHTVRVREAGSTEDSEMLAIWSDKDNRFYAYNWQGSFYSALQYGYSTAESYLKWCDDIEFKEGNVKRTNAYIEAKGHDDRATETYRITNDEYKVCIYRSDSESSTWSITNFSTTVTMQVGHEDKITDIHFEE